MGCAINGEPGKGQCCCNCKHHALDMSHPCTDGGRMIHQRGWICAAPIGKMPTGQLKVYSGWSEHGMCELWTAFGEGEYVLR